MQLGSIHVGLDAFTLNGASVCTSLRLDQIILPSQSLSELAGQRLQYPLNPEEGYIDGSIYINGEHYPVDVAELRFGNVEGCYFELRIVGVLVLENEGLFDYANTAFELVCRLRMPLTRDQIDALIQEAILESKAKSIKESGKVMALLKQKVSGHEDMSTIHRRVLSMMGTASNV